jgi:predicted nucleic acid-binding protein
MKIVVDTNVIFSALVNSQSAIAEIIIGSQEQQLFYASDYTRVELDKHHEKLKKASRLNDADLNTAKYELFKSIRFVSLAIIPETHWQIAEQLVRDIDVDDVAFVALALYLQAYLWTGDKRLYAGLKAKGFDTVLSTQELMW